MFSRLRPEWHRITKVDPIQKIGTCSVCGLVRVRRRKSVGSVTWWRCKKQFAQQKARRRDPSRFASGELYRQHLGPSCERCGFVPEHRGQLDVDHVDGNHDNNDPANLQTLCANCHRLKTIEDQMKRAAPDSSQSGDPVRLPA